jgi:hypothetical protein
MVTTPMLVDGMVETVAKARVLKTITPVHMLDMHAVILTLTKVLLILDWMIARSTLHHGWEMACVILVTTP